MTNRISEYLIEGDDEGGLAIPASPVPTSEDHVTVTYAGRGLYVVGLNDPRKHHDGVYEAVYAGPLGSSLKMAQRVWEGLNLPSDHPGTQGGPWWDEAVEMVVPNSEYTPDMDLTPGEIHWWVELDQYGPYPGDDWYQEKMDEQDEQDLEDLNR